MSQDTNSNKKLDPEKLHDVADHVETWEDYNAVQQPTPELDGLIGPMAPTKPKEQK